jgi:hypothetical protein
MLLGRALMDPSPAVIAEMTRLGDEPMRLFLSLMQRACPELTLAELDWRVNCVLGAQVFSQPSLRIKRRITRSRRRALPEREALQLGYRHGLFGPACDVLNASFVLETRKV